MSVNIERKRLFSGFDGKMCKVDPQLMTDGERSVMLWSMLLLSGSDVFFDGFSSVSCDGFRTFSEPKSFSIPDRFEDGVRCNVFLREVFYSKHSERWLYFGSELRYADDKHPQMIDGISLTSPVFAFIDPESGLLDGEARRIPFPFEAPGICQHGQIIEAADGTLLLSFYVTTAERKYGSVMTVRYALDGDELRIVESGEPIWGEKYSDFPKMRGLVEPSVACLNRRFYMTIRNDIRGYFAESDDGLRFSEPKPWCFDDGSELGSCNTMQRWVRFDDALYLVYTRRDRLNNHVFRNRAPLYMTRFDELRGCLIRDEEIILVPELGARLGNFSVTDISPSEALLTVAEWMQPIGCEKYGSDNSIWLVKIKNNKSQPT